VREDAAHGAIIDAATAGFERRIPRNEKLSTGSAIPSAVRQ
jgi:hypothetical protein